MIEYFMPSEIARLVLGYLKDIGCVNSANLYLSECAHLKEYVECLKNGNEYPTTIGGKNLFDVLKEYCRLRAYEKELLSNVTCEEGNKSDEVVAYLKSLSQQSTSHTSQRNLFNLQKKPARWAVVAGQRQTENKECCVDEDFLLVQEDKPNTVDNAKLQDASVQTLNTSVSHSVTQTSTLQSETNSELISAVDCLSEKNSIATKDAACSPVRFFVTPVKENSVTPVKITRCLASYSTPTKNGEISDGGFRTPKRKSQLPRKRHGSTPQSARKRSCHSTPCKDDNTNNQEEETFDFSVVMDHLMSHTALHEKIAENINNAVKPTENVEAEPAKASLKSALTEEEAIISEALIKDVLARTEADAEYVDFVSTFFDSTLKDDGGILLDCNGPLNVLDTLTLDHTVSDIDDGEQHGSCVTDFDRREIGEQILHVTASNTPASASSYVVHTPATVMSQHSEGASPCGSSSSDGRSVQSAVGEQTQEFSSTVSTGMPNSDTSVSASEMDANSCSRSTSNHATPDGLQRNKINRVASKGMNLYQRSTPVHCVIDGEVTSESVTKSVQIDSMVSAGSVATYQQALIAPADGSGIQQILVAPPNANLNNAQIQVSNGLGSVPSVILQQTDTSLSNLLLISTPSENGTQNFQLVRVPVPGASVTPTIEETCIKRITSAPALKRTLKTNAKRPVYLTPIMPKQKIISSRTLDFHQSSTAGTIQPSVFYSSSTTTHISTENVNSPISGFVTQKTKTVAKSPQLVSLVNSIGSIVNEKQSKPGRHVRALEFGSPPKAGLCKDVEGNVQTVSQQQEASIVKTVTNCQVSATEHELIDATSACMDSMPCISSSVEACAELRVSNKASSVKKPSSNSVTDSRRSSVRISKHVKAGNRRTIFTPPKSNPAKRMKTKPTTVKSSRKPTSDLGDMDVDGFLSTLQYVE